MMSRTFALIVSAEPFFFIAATLLPKVYNTLLTLLIIQHYITLSFYTERGKKERKNKNTLTEILTTFVLYVL